MHHGLPWQLPPCCLRCMPQPRAALSLHGRLRQRRGFKALRQFVLLFTGECACVIVAQPLVRALLRWHSLRAPTPCLARLRRSAALSSMGGRQLEAVRLKQFCIHAAPPLQSISHASASLLACLSVAGHSCCCAAPKVAAAAAPLCMARACLEACVARHERRVHCVFRYGFVHVAHPGEHPPAAVSYGTCSPLRGEHVPHYVPHFFACCP